MILPRCDNPFGAQGVVCFHVEHFLCDENANHFCFNLGIGGRLENFDDEAT